MLLLATNRIHHDLNVTATSNYIAALALIALSEICTAEMCRELVADVILLIDKGLAFIKKKAALAASRMIKKLPETCDDFYDKIDGLMEDRHHGVLLATLGLVEEIALVGGEKYKEKFKKYIPSLIRILKGLVSAYSAEFDISGVSDPFLQIQIIKFFRIMGTGNEAVSEDVSDILA